MYWGEGAIHLATSSDLIRCEPVEDRKGEPIECQTTPGRFDSSFPETGPPPVLTRRGILVIYNGKNAASEAIRIWRRIPMRRARRCSMRRIQRSFWQNRRSDTAAGAALRKERQYSAGTTFAEGLVYFHDRWFLYYGCADSLVAVVTARGIGGSPGSE